MGLQISLGLGNEVSLSGIEWRYWAEVPRISARDCAKQRNDYLCRFYQQRPCAYADRNTSELVSIQGCVVSERQELAQDACEVSAAKEEVLGSICGREAIWLASSGNVTDEVWKAYIENQKPNEPDDGFSVLQVAFRQNDRLSAVT